MFVCVSVSVSVCSLCVWFSVGIVECVFTSVSVSVSVFSSLSFKRVILCICLFI